MISDTLYASVPRVFGLHLFIGTCTTKDLSIQNGDDEAMTPIWEKPIAVLYCFETRGEPVIVFFFVYFYMRKRHRPSLKKRRLSFPLSTHCAHHSQDVVLVGRQLVLPSLVRLSAGVYQNGGGCVVREKTPTRVQYYYLVARLYPKKRGTVVIHRNHTAVSNETPWIMIVRRIYGMVRATEQQQ